MMPIAGVPLKSLKQALQCAMLLCLSLAAFAPGPARAQVTGAQACIGGVGTCTPLTINKVPVQGYPVGTGDSNVTPVSGEGKYAFVVYNGTSPAPPSNLPPGNYPAWCGTEQMHPSGPATYTATTIPPASDSPSYKIYMPGFNATRTAMIAVESPLNNQVTWNEINYLINHKGARHIEDIQVAIWLIMGGPMTSAPSADAQTLYNESTTPTAQAYVPKPGERQMVLLMAPNDSSTGWPSIQHMILEVPVCNQIGDRVWQDTTTDGLQNATPIAPFNLPQPITFLNFTVGANGYTVAYQYPEAGINGVKLQLMQSPDGGLTLTPVYDANGNPMTAITGQSPRNYPYLPWGTNGYYQFAGLCDGMYYVKIDRTDPVNAAALSGMIPTDLEVGGAANYGANSRDEKGAKAILPNPITKATADETLDFGYKGAGPLLPNCLPTESNTGKVGVYFDAAFTGSGGVPFATGSPYLFSTASALPGGLSLKATGELVGYPTEFGSFPLLITIADSQNRTTSQSCPLEVKPIDLSLACAQQGEAMVGKPYSASLNATGGITPYTFSIDPTTPLPADLTLTNTSTGLISGIPQPSALDAGGNSRVWKYTARVTDNRGASSMVQNTTCGVTVRPPISLVCLPAPVTVVYGSAMTNVQLVALGGNGVYKFTSTTLPAGLSLSTSGLISGTPTADPGTYPAKITIESAGYSETFDCVTVTIKPRPAQLKVVKTPDNGVFTSGGPVSFTIEVSNPASSPADSATNVTVTDTLPGNGGLTWTSATTDKGVCSLTGNALSCTVGTLAAGAKATIVVSSPATTPADACQSQPNPAAIATADGGLTAEDGGSLTCYPPAQLRVVKTPDNGVFTMGSQVSFTILVSNPATAGALPANNVKLTDTLPVNGGLTWTAATTTKGACSLNGSTLNCTIGTLAAGESATVVVSSPATTPAAACELQDNPVAQVTADGGLTAQDSGSLTCTAPPAQLKVEKTPDNGVFTMGSQVSFTITVSNTATAGLPATNVKLNDVLPSNGGLSWGTATASQGACTLTGANLSCLLGTIAGGASATVTVTSTATTPAAACQSQPNPAAIATADGGITAQDSGSLTCTAPPAKLVVEKTPDNGAFSIATQTTFKIEVSNATLPGSLPATNVTLSDALPTNGGLTWTSANTDQGSCRIANNVLNCSLGDIAAGASVTVNVYTPLGTPVTACMAQPNPAAIATADGGLTAQDAGSVSCTPPPTNLCGLTWGYWKNHNWPAYPAMNGLTFGGQTYTAQEIKDILAMSVSGDASLDLAHQLIAALLNVYNGTDFRTDTNNAITKADLLLAQYGKKLPLGVPQSDPNGALMVQYASWLDYFNQDGKAQPGCANGPTGLIVACAAGSATVGAPYRSAVTASGGMGGPYTFTLVSGSLPPGLTLDAATGAITGTPTDDGAYSFSIQVADSSAVAGSTVGTVTTNCTIVVTGAIQCPTATAKVNESYASPLVINGGTDPYLFAISSGSLPPGLVLDTANGAIKGTPTTAGTYTFTIKATDLATGASITSNCTIVVSLPSLALTCPSPTAQTTVYYSSPVGASGGAAPYTFSLASGALPTGLTGNPSTGQIFGIPTATGTFTFTVKALDYAGATASASCSIVVTAPTGTISAGMFTTYTQGGWGAAPKGNNPGVVLSKNFAAVYGSAGVTIGGTNKLTFTSAGAIDTFLPQGGTASALKSSATNPSTSYGVLAGQVLALQLSVDFSNKGITCRGLSSLHIVSGKLAGYTVGQVLTLANAVLGGSVSALPAGISIADLNAVVDSINNNFDNGTTNKGYLKY